MATAKKAAAKKPAAKKGRVAPARRVGTDDSLSISEERFVHAYLLDPNATRAYLKACPGVKESSAAVAGHRLLNRAKVAAEIAKAQDKLAEKAGISAERLVQEAVAIALADARELSSYHVGCCRFCWGEGHLYQRTANEFRHDEALHAQVTTEAIEAGKPAPKDFDPKGGIGYDERREAHQDCPECFGRGVGRTVFHDTRKLSPQAAALFAGVKETKDGLEFKTHSKEAAMEKLAKHLGIYERDNSQKTPVLPETALFAMDEKMLLAIAAMGKQA